MTVTLIEPQSEPIFLRDLKDFLRLDVTDTSADGDLSGLVIAAREWVEDYLGKFLVSRTVRSLYDYFPAATAYCSAEIDLPYFPASSIVALNYLGADGAMAQLAADQYDADLQSQPARLAPKWGRFWPIINTPRASCVQIDYVTGYGEVLTVTTTAGQKTITGAGILATHAGKLASIAGAGPNGSTLRARILLATSGSATLDQPAVTAASNTVTLVGIPGKYQDAVKMYAAWLSENRVSQGDFPQYIKTSIRSNRNTH